MRQTTIVPQMETWERRCYWRQGRLADQETRHNGRVVLASQRSGARTAEADYCQVHGTRLAADLACPYCGERPGAAEPAQAQTGDAPRNPRRAGPVAPA